jgi:hypothetical protein
MTRLGIIAVLALLACGGPRKAGTQANQTYFWKVVSSNIEFGQCSDETMFRAGLMPLKFEANSYLIYKADKSNATATTQTCTTLDTSTCMPSASPVVFTVAGSELAYSTSAKSALGVDGCQLLDTTTWLLTDAVTTGSLEITHVLSEVDNAAACTAAETQVKAQSPNMQGLEGCVVTFKVGMTMN